MLNYADEPFVHVHDYIRQPQGAVLSSHSSSHQPDLNLKGMSLESTFDFDRTGETMLAFIDSLMTLKRPLNTRTVHG